MFAYERRAAQEAVVLGISPARGKGKTLRMSEHCKTENFFKRMIKQLVLWCFHIIVRKLWGDDNGDVYKVWRNLP